MNLEAGKTVIGVVRAKNYNGTEEEVEIIYAGPENGYARYGNGELQKVKPEQYKLLLDEYIKEHNRKEEVEEILGGDNWDDDEVPIETVQAQQKNTRTFPSRMSEEPVEEDDGDEDAGEDPDTQFYAPDVRKKNEVRKAGTGTASDAKKESLKNNKAFRLMIIIAGVFVIVLLISLGIKFFAGKNDQTEAPTQEQTETAPAENETYKVAALVGDIAAGKEITENDICLKEIDSEEYATISNRVYIDAEGNEFSSPVAMWDAAADIIGATANRNILAGTVLTEKDFTVPVKEENPVRITATVTDEEGKTYEIDLGEYMLGAEAFKNLTENKGKEQLLDVIENGKAEKKSPAKEQKKETESETTTVAETEETAPAEAQAEVQAEVYYAPVAEPAPARSAEPVEEIPYLEDVTEG